MEYRMGDIELTHMSFSGEEDTGTGSAQKEIKISGLAQPKTFAHSARLEKSLLSHF